MGPRLPLALLALAAILTLGAPPARAQFTYDTLMVTDTTSCAPAIVVGPDGVLHVVVPVSRGYRHFRRVGGIWSQQVISPPMNVNNIDLAIGSSNRLAALRRGAGGQLIVLRPGAGTFWDADTIPGTSGLNSRTTPSLQLDPATDEPVVAFTTRPTGSNQLWLARRTSGGWSVVRMDSSSGAIGEPSLALDSSGRIRLAVAHELGPQGQGLGLYYVQGDSETGPFTWDVADTLYEDAVVGLFDHASLRFDPITGDPRIGHAGQWYLRFANRAAGVWTSGEVAPSFCCSQWWRPISFALDGAGRPQLFALSGGWILSTESPAADPACSAVATFAPFYFEREQATGTDPFTHTYLGEHDGEGGPRAIAFHGGRTRMVWLDTIGFSCWPSRVVFAESPIVASVTPAPPRVSALQLAPNPARAGNSLRVRLSLVADGPVALHLTDVAGRSVARIVHQGNRGEGEVRWTLPSLAAGWYRLAVRQGGTTLGTAPLLVVD